MSLYALDNVDDAIAATRALLLPFDLRRWLKLAFVVFFLGGTGAVNPFQFGGGTPGSTPGETPGGTPTESVQFPTPSEIAGALSPTEWAIVGAVVGTILLVALAFAFVGAVMEFVFVESLSRERVSIRQYWGARWRQGARLLGFRIVVGLLSLLVGGGALLAAFWPVLFGNAGISFGLVVLAIGVFIGLAVVSGLLNGFTTQFVVPVMIAEDRGVLAAWRQFWPTLTGQWKQYLAYVFVRFVLGIAVAVVVGIVSFVGTLVLAIPFGILGVVGFGLLSVSQPIGWAAIAATIALFVLTLIVISVLVAVPVKTYLRYYALLVLGDTEDAFDLVAERRRAIRE